MMHRRFHIPGNRTGIGLAKPMLRQPAFAPILVMAMALAACNKAPAETAPFTRLTPPGVAESQKLWNYSQAIVINPGTKLVEVAGTTGDDSNGNIVNPTDFAAQVDRTFANLEVSLKAAGASGKDVVRVRLYVVGLDGEKHWPALNAAMRRHFGDQGPTSTMVGVQALAAPDILFEMDATAAIR
jgi:enamine deaminase RidA (YjgF/YER057c/UK114 family)